MSVIVRARDEAARIGRCLELVRTQEVQAELIVVDNASSDETAEIAERAGATVLHVPAGTFSFGGALNLGAAHASGEILVALSADAQPTDAAWLGRLRAVFEDERVACASSDRFLPDGTLVRKRIVQDEQLLAGHPGWGYSNGAGGFRAELWRRRPFRADLPGCEDLEWSAYWIAQGHVCIIDPALAVVHDHTHDPLPSIYRRARREAEGRARYLAQPPQRPAELAAEWWRDLRFYDSPLRARLSHRRAARLLGAYAGRRRAQR